MSHEPVTTKSQPPAPPAARRAPAERRREKLFALRFVALLCAVLAVALVAAQGALAFQEEDTTPAEAEAEATPTPASQQKPDAQAPATTRSPAAAAAAPAPTPAPRVMRVYRIDAEFKDAPSPTAMPTATPTPPPTPSPTPCPRGQTCPTPTQAPPPKPAPTPAPPEFKNRAEATSAGLNNIVIVEVAGLKQLIYRSKCLKEQPNQETGEPDLVRSSNECREQPILLFIDGRPLKGMQPESGAPELKYGDNGTLRYHLQRPAQSDAVDEADVADTKEHWEDLLGYSPGDLLQSFPPSLTRRVSVSVGLGSEYPIETEVKQGGTAGPFNLVRVRSTRFFLWLVLIAGFILVFLWMVRKKGILSDRKPVAWVRGNRQRKAFSLARSQIAWWTFFVLFGFVFIWLVTGQYDLSPSVLVLLGISVITTAGSVAIDKSRSFDAAGDVTETNAVLSQLLTEKDKMEEELNDAYEKIPEKEFKKEQSAYKEQIDKFKELERTYKAHIKDIRKRFPTALGWNHESFHIDILSDANGVSIQRFQMALWTVVLGFVFVHEVASRLSMPKFSGTLLLLLGISNGAYLLGKSSEPQATPSSGQTTPDTDAGDGDGGEGGGDGTANTDPNRGPAGDRSYSSPPDETMT